MASERQLQELGVFVHGVLTGLHLLGAIYNFRRRNWTEAVLHGGVAAYDTWAAARHLRALERC